MALCGTYGFHVNVQAPIIRRIYVIPLVVQIVTILFFKKDYDHTFVLSVLVCDN